MSASAPRQGRSHRSSPLPPHTAPHRLASGPVTLARRNGWTVAPRPLAGSDHHPFPAPSCRAENPPRLPPLRVRVLFLLGREHKTQGVGGDASTGIGTSVCRVLVPSATRYRPPSRVAESVASLPPCRLPTGLSTAAQSGRSISVSRLKPCCRLPLRAPVVSGGVCVRSYPCRRSRLRSGPATLAGKNGWTVAPSVSASTAS
jgi:hypothetical protein